MKEYSKYRLIPDLLTRPATSGMAGPIAAFADWRSHCADLFQRWSTPVERAIAGGFESIDTGFAFAFGYQAALQQMAPGHIDQRPASFCVTEAGGNSPSAIQTRLTRITPEQTLLQGEKTFITNADQAELLLVAASTGEATTGPDGKARNPLAMVLVPAQSPGVSITPLPALPFAPSIHHGVARFEQVVVTAAQWLPGDGYSDYVKPFRTVEDIHVSAALLGFLLRIARAHRWPTASIEALLALIALHQWLAALPPKDSSTHLILAGARQQMEDWLQANRPHWDLCPPGLSQAWQRDSALLKVAGKARVQRTQSAWNTLQGTS